MTRVTIYDTLTFKVISYGNGTGYALIHKKLNQDVFFQDDDAINFIGDIDACEYHHPEWSTERVLREQWNTYSEVAQPCQ